MDLQTGTIVDGRYRVERLLGQGGQASVYLVRHVALGSLHALKVVHAGGEARARILQEGRVQAVLKHPHVVRVTDVVLLGPALGLIMEYVEGPDLARVLARRRLSLAHVDVVAKAVLSAMAAAHDLGLVHRDLKPENILLDDTSHGLVPKVTDFGLALRLDAPTRRTPMGAALGTPFYMSPEQVRDGHAVDHRSDLWAIGAILYELVSGRLPFDGDSLIEVWNQVEQARPAPLRELEPALPERMVVTIEGALVRNPDARFHDARSMLASWEDASAVSGDSETLILDLDFETDARDVQEGRGLAAPTWTRTPPARTPRRAVMLTAIVLFLFGAASAAAGFSVLYAGWSARSRPSEPVPGLRSATPRAAAAPVTPPWPTGRSVADRSEGPVDRVGGEAPALTLAADVAEETSSRGEAPEAERSEAVEASLDRLDVEEPPPAPPVELVPRVGRVTAVGASVFLRQGRARLPVPGEVPIGEYEVHVAFGAQPSFAYPRALVVEEGRVHEVLCNPTAQLCSYRTLRETP